MDGHNMTVSIRSWNDLNERLEQQRMELARLKKDRRERIASMAMQGILSNSESRLFHGVVALDAVLYADALIEGLEKEKK